ncbi:hypothetical protein H7K45_12550 [Mycobacterium yunnanensis]|uniref:Uncharacterized protein n=1 Tax=Mycobacterium yunnanensis TaxID=368477 RepID=A0A9X2Z240_9MYCO|nr:hypothetical protein [Mycobacterium yunnanensis]MCV7421374.1 hypothetical protein [Mycobacterium yunnanensis]
MLPLLASAKNPARGRRLFWSGLVLAVGSAFFIAYPPNWKSGLGLSTFVAAMMLFTAFFTTPYLKVGGKVFAFFTIDAESEETASNDVRGAEPRSRPAQRTGALTSARKLWWLMVPAMALCVFNVEQFVVAGENPRLAAAMAAVIVVVALTLGYGDGRADFGFARKQFLQFVIVSVMTLGTLAVLYAVGYAVGRQMWRRRQDGTRQAELPG